MITCARLPWEEVWTPDIVLYNAAGDGEQGREMRTLIQVPHCTLCHVPRVPMPRVQVDYQGNVTLLTQAIYMSKCMVDVTYYPFDMQVQYSTVRSTTVQYSTYYPFDMQLCELKFASWTTEVTRVSVV